MEYVFVYGTLMKGQNNHHNYLAHSKFIGAGEVTGYALYQVSSFPGIVPESGEKVKGEVYQVDQDILKRLDDLEGEGSLYIRRKVDADVRGDLVPAWTYVWNHSINGNEKVGYKNQPWQGRKRKQVKKQYVWYACYGSNLLKERFMNYIEGGVCRFNGTTYAGCTDKSAPIEDRPCTIKHELYFANRSGKWDDGGVVFLDPKSNEKAETWCRMYLIKEEQFKEVQSQECISWYNKVLDLGMEDDIPIKTFTHANILPINNPSPKYIQVIKEGLRETYPDKSFREIIQYVEDHITCIEEKLMHALHLIRKSPRRMSVFEIINSVGHKLEKAHEIIEPLLERGYIRQDGRDHFERFHTSSSYYTVPAKRLELDQLLRSDSEKKKLSSNQLIFSEARVNDRILACVNCRTFYKVGTTFCRECLHSTCNLDSQIADIIFVLNNKGYRTAFCCAGHRRDDLPYISCRVDIRGLSLPLNFALERSIVIRMIPYYKVKGITKKKMEQTVSDEELTTYRLENVRSLRTWVNQLPMKKDCELCC